MHVCLLKYLLKEGLPKKWDINRLVIVLLSNPTNSSIYYSFLWSSQTFFKGKVFNIRNISFYLVKLINLKKFNKSNENPIFLNVFCDIYELSLFISVRAFLPSLRVLKISQEKEEIIKMVSVIREIKVVSILLINLLGFFQSL